MTTVVADIMTREVVTLTAGSDLALADDVMKLERVRHLPVVEHGKLIGLVSHRDIIKAHARLLVKAFTLAQGDKQVATVGVHEGMQTDLKTVTPDTRAVDASRLILESRFGCLPVVEDGNLIGIVTEVDCLKWALSRLGPED